MSQLTIGDGQEKVRVVTSKLSFIDPDSEKRVERFSARNTRDGVQYSAATEEDAVKLALNDLVSSSPSLETQ